MNSHQIFNQGIFLPFVFYIQLLFYSEALTKVGFMERTLPSTLGHWHSCAPPAIWSCASAAGDLKIKSTGKRSSWHGGRPLPPCSQIKAWKSHFFPGSFPLWPFSSLIRWRSVKCFYPSFALIWPGDIMLLFTYLQNGLFNLQTIVGLATILVIL